MDINKKEDPENLLFNVKKISDNITDITTKINNRESDEFSNTKSCRILMLLKELGEIKKRFENIMLKNPRFLNEQITDLYETIKVCERFENKKKQLLSTFIPILGEFEKFNTNIDSLSNDKKISGAFNLIKEITVIKDKKVNFPSFKGFILKSPYISFSKTEQKLQVSYDIFNFDLRNIIPSLYGNSTYSINILSFVGKELKAELIKNSISNKNY